MKSILLIFLSVKYQFYLTNYSKYFQDKNFLRSASGNIHNKSIG